MLRCYFSHRRIEMLGHRFAAESARDRANGCTYHGPSRSSKPDSNRVGTRRASNRVEIRPSLSRGVMVHVVLRCTVKEEATVSGRVNTVCTVPHANEGRDQPQDCAVFLAPVGSGACPASEL